MLPAAISAVNLEQALQTIEGWIKRRDPNCARLSADGSAMETHCDHVLCNILNANERAIPDGVLIEWVLRRPVINMLSAEYVDWNQYWRRLSAPYIEDADTSSIKWLLRHLLLN